MERGEHFGWKRKYDVIWGLTLKHIFRTMDGMPSGPDFDWKQPGGFFRQL